MKYLIVIFVLYSLSCKSQDKNLFINPYSEPLLIGGIDSLMIAIKPVTELPSTCLEQGKVYVQFCVSINGNVKGAKIIRGLCCQADSISLEIIRTLKFEPATQNGIPYEVSRIFPITFY